MRLYVGLISMLLVANPAFSSQTATAQVSVCFTPAEQCEGKIVDAIDRAQSSIRVQAYGFTSFPIIHALQRAAGQGRRGLGHP